jgi:predicted PurR-regulated permease PerM
VTSAKASRAKPDTPSAGSATAVQAVVVALLSAAALFLAWMAADALLLIFAGLLVAALLDACTRGLSSLLPIHRGWNLAIVIVAVTIAITGLIVWSGFSIAQQITAVIDTLGQQLQALEHNVSALGVGASSEQSDASAARNLVNFLFPNPHQLFGEAQSAFTLALGGIGEAIIVVLIGGFVAADPGAYRRGLIELLPLRHRERAGFVLDETAIFLRRWLVGQLAAMLLLAILTWIVLFAVGVPNAALLAIQAGLFNFVPYLGAVGGGVPILLMALPLGITPMLVALGLFTLIHVGVGYVVVPLIQKQAVHLPPALTLASLILFGALFGVASVAVATPLVASMRHAYMQLRRAGPARMPRKHDHEALHSDFRAPAVAEP